jgi:diguanylate cyclase (GGDEF)-like protein
MDVKSIFWNMALILLFAGTPAISSAQGQKAQSQTAAPTQTGPAQAAFDAQITAAKSNMMRDPEAAKIAANRAQSLAKSLPVDQRALAQATSLWLRSEALTRMGQPKAALPVIDQAMAQLNGKERATKLYGDLIKSQAAAYAKLGDVTKSLPLLHRAFAIYAKLDESRAQAIILHNIGAIYYDARDYPRMLDYLNQAEKLGNALKEMGRFAEAYAEYTIALKIARDGDNRLAEVNSLSNLAAAQLLDGKYDRASATLAQAQSRLNGPSMEVRPFLFGTAAEIALRQGDITKAKSLIEKALAGVDPKISTKPYRDVHETAYNIYTKSGQIAAALAHLEAFKRLDDGGRDLAASTNDALMTAQFDTANKKLQISKLEAQQAQRNLALAQSDAKLQRYAATITLGLLTICYIALGFAYSVVVVRRRRKAMAESNEKLAHAATHDVLTGLPNRSHFKELVDESLKNAMANDGKCAVLMMDLDRFKWVNDTQGHVAGDELLCQVASALTDVVGTTGQAVRLGGDEFAIILPNFQNIIDVEYLAQKIVDRVQQPFDTSSSTLQIGATIGIAIGPDDGDSMTRLLRSADLALYAGKQAGRNCTKRFVPEMLQAVEEQITIRDDLRHALSRGELKIVYQAIVDIADHRTIGYEALVRWDHPSLGAISPSIFIPIAEETGLISGIGDWILRTACAQAVQWGDDVSLSVNLSAIQIKNRGLAGQIMQALAASGLAAERLELEVTESVFLGDDNEADQTLDMVRALGVKLALDDFGTGYSSLSYLRRAKFTTIKIDRSFVRAASDGSNESAAIIRAIVSMAEEIGMQTTAEGIETKKELDFIRGLGCTQAQGYYFAAPAATPLILDWAASQAA